MCPPEFVFLARNDTNFTNGARGERGNVITWERDNVGEFCHEFHE